MASIKEAYDSTMKEAYTGIKIFLWAIPIAYTFNLLKMWNWQPQISTNIFSDFGIFVGIYFLLFGFVVTLARNVVKKTQYIVPGINIFEILINAVIGLVAALPYGILGFFIYQSCSLVELPGEILNGTFHIIVNLFAVSLPLSAICLLIRRMNIMDAFNLKKFFSGFFIVFLDYSYFGIRAGLILGVVFSFFVYLFTLFIGFDNAFWLYLLAIGFMFIITLYANAIAQISDDIYTFQEKEEQKRKEDELVKKVIDSQSTIRDER